MTSTDVLAVMDGRTELPEPLASMAPDDRAVLAGLLEERAFPAGSCIFRAGSSADGFYVIVEGDVRVEVERPAVDSDTLDTDGTLGYSGPGSLLGELAVLDGQPRSASAVAETDVLLQHLSTASLQDLLAREPRAAAALALALGRDASLKLRKATDRLAEFVVPEGRDAEVDAMVARAQVAQASFADWSESRVDELLTRLAEAVAAQAGELASATVAETSLGNVTDKTAKNWLASMGVLGSLVGRPASGLLRTDEASGVSDIASPVGVVFGIIPMTNPVATGVFKALIALKSRNALVMSFHRSCAQVGDALGRLLQDTLVEAGAPADLVQWVRGRSSRTKTARFMRHEGVSLVLATGGGNLVAAAYSSGTPALGVGPGNAPVLVAADADLDVAAAAIVQSKSFDNGLICGAEHNLVITGDRTTAFSAALERAGAAVLTAAEAERFTAAVVQPDGRHFSPQIVGQDAATICELLGIRRDFDIRVVVVPVEVDLDSAYAGEKMAPVLSLFTVPDDAQGFVLCRRLLDHQGAGHTAVIHSSDEELVAGFGTAMPASRILVNSPGSFGVCGITSGLDPSFTLGCGTFGGNSTTDNVTYRHLLNVKRLARFREPQSG